VFSGSECPDVCGLWRTNLVAAMDIAALHRPPPREEIHCKLGKADSSDVAAS
jgi:hypothetical protein